MKENSRFPIFVIALTIFIDITGFGIVLPLLPFYADIFGADSFTLGLVVASFSVMQFIFSPILGRLSDRYGRKPILLLSIFFSGISFVLFAIANSLLMLFISRFVAGMATESAIARAYIADVTTEEERTGGIGKVGAAFGAGFIVGPVIGGLTSVYGFSAPGFTAAALTLLNFLLVLLFLPQSPYRKSSEYEKEREGLNYLKTLKLGLRKQKIGLVLAITFMVILAFSAIPVILPLLGIDFFGFQEVEMSYFFMYIGVVQIILQGFLIGRLTDKLGDELMIVLGTASLTFGTFFVALFPNIILFVVCITFIAGGIGILNTSIPSFVSKRSSADEQGGGMGVVESVSSIARIPGPILGGFVFQFAGLFFAFSLSALLSSLAFLLSCRVFQTCKLE